jgi:hypothetical protein
MSRTPTEPSSNAGAGAGRGGGGGPGLVRPQGRIGADQTRVTALARNSAVAPGNAIMSRAQLEAIEAKFVNVFPGSTAADIENLRSDILTDLFVNGGTPSFHNDPKSPPIVYMDPNGNQATADRVATYSHLFGNEAVTTGGGLRKYCKSYPDLMLSIASNGAIQEILYAAGITIADRVELFGMAQARQLVAEAENLKKKRIQESREGVQLEAI